MLDIHLQTDLLNRYSASRIIGIDEVGRGAWAGPVVVGGYIWQPTDSIVPGVRDSKLIKLAERESISTQLNSQQIILKQSSARDIDSRGIANVIRSLVLNIVDENNDGTTLFIVDGQFKNLPELNLLQAFKADNTFYAVATAAIAAKVYRDNLMAELAISHPGYVWESNRGYGTAAHAKGIQELGVNEFHRQSFVPRHLFV